MDAKLFLEACQFRAAESQRHRDLIRALNELRLSHEWDEILDGVREARYEAECGDESDDSDYNDPRSGQGDEINRMRR